MQSADPACSHGRGARGSRQVTEERPLPLHTVEPLRLYRQIAGQIAALIDNGEFPAGSRLPAERELASLLGVSRTSVREAIISLEIAGRVEVRVGSGIFVAEPGAAAIVGAVDEGPSPFELLAARRLVEGEIAALAARSAKKAEIAAMRATVVRMRENANDFAKRNAADREFHVLLAAATGNGSLVLVVNGLWQQRRGKLWSRIEAYFHTQKIRDATLVDHAAIIAAVEQHVPDAARAAMHRHLARVEREFQRQWDFIVPGDDTKSGVRRAGEARKRNVAHPLP
jgi:GntR family uxuAB operon transcriptional repressor